MKVPDAFANRPVPLVMRFFGGLTVDETSVVLRISPAPVRHEWSAAKICLHRECSHADLRRAERGGRPLPGVGSTRTVIGREKLLLAAE